MQVKGFKDICGQEFVAELISESVDYVEINNPLSLIPTEKGAMPLPYLMSNRGSVKFPLSKLILGPFDIESNMSNQYKSMFGGGIIEPEKKSLIL